jgi:hypothetical protein
LDIQHGDVRLVLLDESLSFFAIARLGDHFHVAGAFKQLMDA